ncbi:hypothetical protein SBA3_1900005 [Candidatus Sulfopaludibacter sp. SbA3]|nr:hypothetical protein SBA3_1900005 [Candidatus Sulfopaludibacter sp. SbA3]
MAAVSYIRSLNPQEKALTLASARALEVTGDRIRHARGEPGNWLTYWGDYGGQHYSPLNQITAANVRQLQAQWALQLPVRRALRARCSRAMHSPAACLGNMSGNKRP